jgi:hypothetical protein
LRRVFQVNGALHISVASRIFGLTPLRLHADVAIHGEVVRIQLRIFGEVPPVPDGSMLHSKPAYDPEGAFSDTQE